MCGKVIEIKLILFHHHYIGDSSYIAIKYIPRHYTPLMLLLSFKTNANASQIKIFTIRGSATSLIA